MGTGEVSRRAVLLASLTLPVAGCGIRFESDTPFLPDPAPDPAGPAIAAERSRVAAIVATADRIDSPLVRRLRPVHRAQLDALDRAASRLDPPITPPAALPTATGTGRAATDHPDLVDLADLEFSALDEPGLADLDSLLPRAAQIVVASHAQRAVALHLLREADAAGGDDVPAVPWVAADPQIARDLVEALRSTAYALEVAAAQSDPRRRPTVLAGLTRLRQAERGLGAGIPDLPPRPLGYPLPAPVRSPGAAAALAEEVLDRLTALVLATSVASASALRQSDRSRQADHSRPSAVAPTLPAPSDLPAPSGPPSDSGVTPQSGTGGSGAMGSLVRLATIAETTRISLGGQVRPLPGLVGTPATSPTTTPSPATSATTPPASPAG